MAKDSSSAVEQTKNNLGDEIEATLKQYVKGAGLVYTGVQRKVNTGNYENIDVYLGLALPIDLHEALDEEKLGQVLHHIALYGFGVAATETAEKYNIIKQGARG